VPQAPKLFTCPKCLHTYLGHDPLPDCPRCGYDYREKEGFRWDLVVYLLAIIGFISFLLVASFYRGNMGATSMAPRVNTVPGPEDEKLPGAASRPFKTPYQAPDR
jgi:rubredoxin